MLKITPRENILSEEEKAEKLGKLNKEVLKEKLLSSHLSVLEEKAFKKIIAEEREANIEDIDILTLHKEIKVQELNKRCNEDILKGFTSNALGEEHFYRFNEEDQANFTMQLAFLNNVIEEELIHWKTEDKGVLAHTKEQFIVVCKDGEIHKRKNISKYWSLKQQVETATTHEEINLIGW